MKQTRLIMGMPVTVEVLDPGCTPADIEAVFDYFDAVDRRFSTYKDDSEISQVNRGLPESEWSPEMAEVMALCRQTNDQTDGYFDINNGQRLDPSGLVKGWAIRRAADLLAERGFKDYYVDAGGDIQTSGLNAEGQPWRIGIRDPQDRKLVVKVLEVSGQAVATSGSYIRGQHVYNPHQPAVPIEDVLSLTVVGPDIYDADRFATAAYAMGRRGIDFVEKLDGFEGYQIDASRQATLTSGFEQYVAADA